jgi:hypothetical protein
VIEPDVSLTAAEIAETSTLKILTATERTKLAGIAENANNYTHPATHPQSMIEGLADALGLKQDKSNAVTTDTNQTITGIKTFNNNAPLIFNRTSGGYYAFQFLFEGETQWRWYQTGQYVYVQHRDSGGNYSAVMRFNYADKRVEFPISPTVPTATESNNSTLAASTEFVQAKAAGSLLTEGTPSGPTAPGTNGMARFDADYFYVCTATNTWVRFPKDGSWT